MNFLRALGTTTPTTADAGLLALRLWFGGVLAVMHGWGKMIDVASFTPHVAKLGLPSPAAFALAAAASEFVGGILLALGLVTRFAALTVAGTMAVAVFMAHGGQAFARKEEAAAYGVAALALLLAGPGRFSLDALLARRAA
jgi:putative oxidoreductase